MNSEKRSSIPKTVRFEPWLYELVSSKINSDKKERKNFSKALHFLVKELREENKQLTDTIAWFKEHSSQDLSSVEEVQKPSSKQFSEKACEMMVYVKEKPVCGDPDAPIPNYLKRNLNAQVCRLCLKLKEKKRKQIQKKEKEEKRKMLQKLMAENHKRQQRINETLARNRNWIYQEKAFSYNMIDDPYNLYG
jgi:hypothetical protein